ncbi:MAG: anhydro-N-acetylmuramic acid kinase [Gammaproteobacteria bacterium]
MSQQYVGLMSGTSMDGIDAVLLAIEEKGCHIVATHSHAFDDDIASGLRELAVSSGDARLDQFGQLDVATGHAFAAAVHALLDSCNCPHGEVRAIGSHGQTVLHNPGGRHPYTLQIGDPNIIAAETGIQTVADFRRRDLALGGQGAPLAPAFHRSVFRSNDEYRVVLNVGGIANITLMQPGTVVSGFDTGPGNTLMDGWIRRHLDRPFDRDGAWASTAPVDQSLLEKMLAHDFFRAPAPKSTGIEEFNLAWLDSILDAGPDEPEPASVQSTLCELTTRTIVDAIHDASIDPGRLLVCGGGARNTELMRRLAAGLQNWTVGPTDDLGIGSEWVEAAAFAWLAHRTLEGLPGNLPEVTGARRETVLGAIFPC